MTGACRPRVLFVDDETRILDGLRRSLRGYRQTWDMSFAPGGEAALEALAENPVDLVVSDMRMPGIDGAELLTQVSRRYPEVARVVLSGHTEPEAAIRVAVAGHRFLSKPTDVEHLVGVIEQLTSHTSQSHGAQARRIAGAVRSLPVLPEQSEGLSSRLGAGEPDSGQAVLLDIGLAAKLLQLAHSAFFGARPRNASIEAVVNATGQSTIQGLVNASHAQWSSVDWPPAVRESLRVTWRHAVATAYLVEAIATPAHIPHAHAAALLQDVGRLACIAAARDSDALGELSPDHFADGVPHRDVGVELLHLWGLPGPIVTAVGQRDTALDPDPSGLGTAGAVRVAHLLIQRTDSREAHDETDDDELAVLLEHPQLTAQRTDWPAAADEASARAERWLTA